MAKSRYKNAGEKRDGGAHIAVPVSVLNGSAYLGLSAHGRMLLWDLAAQYRGDNNGDMCAAWKLMHPRGWKSKETLNNAKKELLGACLIVETVKGARPNKCSLYAFAQLCRIARSTYPWVMQHQQTVACHAYPIASHRDE